MPTLLLQFVKGLYIIYMFNYFKTSYSIHHPWERLFTGNISNWLQHPIHSGQYENKICPFGKNAAFVIFLWFLAFYLLKNQKYPKIDLIHKNIMILILLTCLVMNLNAFIYFLPVFILDLHQ